jgi:hypothetical protein
MNSRKSNHGLGQRGMALVVTLMLLLVFSVMGVMLMYSITSTVKSSGLLSQEAFSYYGTVGGVFAVAGYMTLYKTQFVPEDILNPSTGTVYDNATLVKQTAASNYSASTQILGPTVRNPVGYSTLWVGLDVLVKSVSPPLAQQVNGVHKEVDAVVFIPNAPVGYGNE